MTDTEPSFGRTWLYRFSLPGGTEIENHEFNGDDTAEAYARQLAVSKECAIVVERRSYTDWKHVTEVDERS